ncbi:hypothetical protein CTAYLR_009295 [Chrysophaeum taylorii]|uniref:BZIP domain-containing protein n=1 Tax=Chrysophaeum taylorii TaxID=2483200 RepID=A0AAD7UJP1_9STRA|nr:hypothetical protein CTAYLR_009295 [Chrysophaeum taylorii]
METPTPPPPTEAPFDDEILALLAPPGEAMDLEWLLEKDDRVWSLQNVSAVSRSLAAVKQEPLSNMSAVSHNLANVGALPQCNQRHARCVAPVAVAEDVPEAVVVQEPSLLDAARPFHFQAAPRKGRRTQRVAATEDQQKKLELRRTKNREAAERMRRRRREETAGLEKAVRELTARCDELSAKLAASEAENQQLRGLKQLVLAVAPQPTAEGAVVDAKLLADHVHCLAGEPVS